MNNQWKTTDRLYELPLYNENGYLNRWYVGKILFFIFSTITIINNLIVNFFLFIKDTDVSIFNIFNSQFLIMYLHEFYNYVVSNFTYHLEKEFFMSIIISMLISAYLTSFVFKSIRELADIQKNLSSLKLDQYYLITHDTKKQEYLFKLKKGEMSRFELFQKKLEDIEQLFKLEKVKVERFEDIYVKILYSEALPDIHTYPKNIDFKSLTGFGKYFMGIEDTAGTPLYATKKEQGNGLLNGNWLIVGGSGSGKSFALKEMIQNMLLEDNYKFIDKIYVINYKASADYNFLRGLDKFRYSDNIADSLKLLKAVLLDMKAKYKHNTINSNDNFLAYQTIIIIDEVQTLNEMLEAKSLNKIMKNTIQESLSILELLGSKIRASNGSLINVLQKADVNSLPSTAYRSNMRNRFMLKQENVSSAHLVINSDTTTEMGINPLRLKQGQFLYWDMLTGKLENGFVVMTGNEADIEKLNALRMDAEAQKVLTKVNQMKKEVIKDIEKENEYIEKLEEDGKKTFADDFEIEEENNLDYEDTELAVEKIVELEEINVNIQNEVIEDIVEDIRDGVITVEEINDVIEDKEKEFEEENSDLDLFEKL